MIRVERLPFVFLALLCLLTGLWTGLSRIGWEIFVLPAVAHHGAVMIGGFLGTLISLEKIIPLNKKALFLIPLASAASAVTFMTGNPYVAMIFLLSASAGLVCVFLFYLIVHRDLIYTLMLVGGLCWFTGNLLLFTKHFYPLAFPWWIGFTLFIITAERIEITRFLPVTFKQKRYLIGFLSLFIMSVLFSFHGIGNLVSGLALIGVSLWLMRFDLVGITIRKNGLTQYVAVALLCGYIALLLSGVFFIVFRDELLAYDALVHTFFIGFVFSMIFAHGPIILPGVLGISVKPFHRVLFFWLFSLQLSWLIRVGADVLFLPYWRKVSGLVSAAAIIGYFVTIAVLTIRGRHAKVV